MALPQQDSGAEGDCKDRPDNDKRRYGVDRLADVFPHFLTQAQGELLAQRREKTSHYATSKVLKDSCRKDCASASLISTCLFA